MGGGGGIEGKRDEDSKFIFCFSPKGETECP